MMKTKFGRLEFFLYIGFLYFKAPHGHKKTFVDLGNIQLKIKEKNYIWVQALLSVHS